MQYLLSVIQETPEENTPEEMAAITAFDDRLKADGRWVFAGGLFPPDAATVVDGRGSDPLVTDGPFLESKEHLIGFWIVDVPDLDVALRLAAEGSARCNRRVEVRPFR